MSKSSTGGYFSARSLSSAVGSRVERICSACGKNFMMDASCHVYRTDSGVQCSWSCFKRAKASGKRKHERKPRVKFGGAHGPTREQCIAQLAENRRALDGTHGRERERINSRISYWRRKLSDIDGEQDARKKED